MSPTSSKLSSNYSLAQKNKQKKQDSNIYNTNLLNFIFFLQIHKSLTQMIYLEHKDQNTNSIPPILSQSFTIFQHTDFKAFSFIRLIIVWVSSLKWLVQKAIAKLLSVILEEMHMQSSVESQGK